MLSAEDRVAIEALHRAWLDAELRGDSSALLQLCTPTPIWLPPNEAPLCGTGSILQWLGDQPHTAVLRIDIDDLAVSGVGSFAWKLARFRTTFENSSGNAGTVTGSHAWLLQRDASGTWRISIVVWTIAGTEPDHPVKSTTRAKLPILHMEGMKDWERWLTGHHESSPGVWLMIAKKGSALTSVSYAEALEAALCHGWIDGQKQAHDSEAWLQKFTPRGARSIWSKINREKAEQLIASGRMMPAGLRAIENAKRNGRWENAYHSAKGSTIPDDFLVAMAKNRKAKSFFETLNSVNRYAILFRIQTAKKAETRARRIEQFIEMLERHEKIHP